MSNFYKIRGKVCVRLILVTMLICLLAHSFTGELIPINGGVGWDGMVYYKMIKDFDNLIMSHGIDQYHMTRFFPFMIIHYILCLFNIPITINTAIISAKVYNGLILILLIYYFFKLSHIEKWNIKTEIIAFSFVFFNFPVLKLFGFYPLLTDCSALVLGYIGLFYYLSKKYWEVYIVGLFSLVTWPVLSAIMLILAVLPYNTLKRMEPNDRFSICTMTILRYSFIFAPIIASLYSLLLYRHDISSMLISFRGETSPIIASLSLFSIIVFYYYSTSPLFMLNWKDFYSNIIRKEVVLRASIGIGLFLFTYRSLTLLGGESGWNLYYQFMLMYKYALTDVLIFLETPFIYLGLFSLLTVMCWREIIYYVKENYGIGYFLILTLFLLMVLDIETRKLTQFYPFILVPLMRVLQMKNVKDIVVLSIPLICLLSSFFWFDIIPSNADSQSLIFGNNFEDRYFMFQGPWQSHTIYGIVITIEILFALIIYFTYKKGLLTN